MKALSILSAVATTIAVTGAALVAVGMPLEANIVWCVSNVLFLVYLSCIREYRMMPLFGVYQLIAVYGVLNLSGVI